MINVSIKKSSKGHRLVIKNDNGHVVNHFYNSPSGAKKAWEEFVKQVKSGKVRWISRSR